ncbi:hypothetical protein BDV59DRAFT_193635 [Aspergillus ambiguus]|uniref:uncharacterized protein n=1 Tax=Aspergillus ambiguus TaxID=176160 RepID=UPI003CCD054C
MRGDDLVVGHQGHRFRFRHGARETIVILATIACYNVVELLFLIPCTFRRWRGLYFWCLLISACLGVLPFSLSNAIYSLVAPDSPLSDAVVIPTMWLMTISQSLVLYSRLHLVLYDRRILRGVLCMIIATSVLVKVPMIVLVYGYDHDLARGLEHSRFLNGYKILGKITETCGAVQDAIISGLYIWETAKLLRLHPNEQNSRCAMRRLVAINVLMILMDVTVMSLEYANLWMLKCALMGAFNSIKLKLEFAVLRKLVDVVQTYQRPTTSYASAGISLSVCNSCVPAS